MADETLDIRVDDGGSTTVVTNRLQALATTGEGVATSVDNVTTALNTNAASATRAAAAVTGYVDANGNYIRQVGSNATASKSAQTATDALKSSISSVTIEQGRAAAGYGALNSATTQSASSSAAFNQSVRGLNQELGTYGTAAGAAASGTRAAADANRDGAGAANGAAGANNNAADSHNRAGRAANDNGNQAAGARARYGAFNETMQDTIRRLGMLAVAFVGVKAADFVTQAENVKAGLNLITQSSAETAAVMGKLKEIQSSLGIDLGSLFAAYRAGSSAFASLKQTATPVVNLIQQISNASRVAADTTGNYQTAAAELFGTLKGGVGTQQTLSLLQSRYPNLLNMIIQAYGKMTAGAGDSVSASDKLTAAFENGTLPISKLVTLFDQMVPAINAASNSAGSTLPVAFNRLYQSIVGYIQTNQTAVAATYALSGALIALSNAPGAVVAGFAAIAGAIVAISLASLISALTVLGTALTTVGTVSAAAVAGLTGLSAATVGAIAGTAALVAGVAAFVYVLATNAKGINDLANSWGGYNTIIGTVLKQVALIGIAYKAMYDAVVTMITTVAEWVAAAGRWAASFGPVKTAVDGIVSAYGYLRDKVTGVYTEITPAVDQFIEKQAAAQAAATPTAGVFDTLINKGKELAAGFTSVESATSGAVVGINTANVSMAQMISLDENGNAIKQQFAQSTGVATGRTNDFAAALARLNAVGAATTGTMGGMAQGAGQAGQAMNQAASGTGTFDSALSHLQQQLNGTQAGVGEFTQATINANAAMSNLEKSSNSSISALGGLATAFETAGKAASFLSIQTKNADTVIGQIGESSGGFSQSYDENFLPLGRGQSGLPQSAIDAQRYSVIMQEEAYKKKIDDMHKAAQRALGVDDGTAANSVVDNTSSALSANTAALQANTAATTSNTTATTLPDLLTSTTSNIVPGLGPSGMGVGSTVTQITNDNSGASLNGGVMPTVRPQATYNGSSTPMPMGSGVGVGMNGDGSLAPGVQSGGMRPTIQPIVQVQIQANDYGQYNRSSRQIAQDIGTSVANSMGAAA